MKHYFEYLPVVKYDIDKDGHPLLVRNIATRFKIRDVLKNRAILFYEYTIADGETPNIVANRFYGKPKLDWLILMANDILDPFFEWPLSYTQFNGYVKEKYGSIPTAHQGIHHYEHIVRQAATTTDGLAIPEKVIIVDEATFDDLVVTDRKSITNFEYEREANNTRKKIKIINKSFIPQILNEVENIFK